MKYRALVLAILLVGACGGNDGSPPPDARPTADARPGTPDGPPLPDAPPGTPDGPPPPDAAPSPVMLISCTGVTPDATIGTSGFAFSPAAVTITAGQIIRFTPTGNHNMTSTGVFATPTSQVACLRFTQPGLFPFFCSVHPSMEGNVTVN